MNFIEVNPQKTRTERDPNVDGILLQFL